MTTTEFSNEFDTLTNSYARTFDYANGQSMYDFVCDEYEKSEFLTSAQRELIIALYTGRTPEGNSFEEKEEVREALDALVKTVSPQQVSGQQANASIPDKICTFYSLPKSLLYIVFEEVKYSSYISGCKAGATALVVPSTHDDLWHRTRNPFRGPSKDRVLRVNASDNVVELVSDYPIGSYLLRYVEEPKPIILTDLPDGLSIEGVSKTTECMLPSILHRRILELAVSKALHSKSLSLGTKASSKS